MDIGSKPQNKSSCTPVNLDTKAPPAVKSADAGAVKKPAPAKADFTQDTLTTDSEPCAKPAAPAVPTTNFENGIKPTMNPPPKVHTVSADTEVRAGDAPVTYAPINYSPIAMFKSAFDDSRQWNTRVGLYLNNDNGVTLLDQQYRSDDGPTSAMGFSIDRTDGNLETHLTFDHSMYTERGWGVGAKRTDLVEMQFAVGQTNTLKPGGLFNRQRTGYSVGIALNGDYGGAQIQNAWHRAMIGTPLTGRLLDGSQYGVPLQNEYTGSGAALTLGYDFEGQRELFADVNAYAGSRGVAALGNAGVSSISLFTGLRAGRERGLFAAYEFEIGVQSVNGHTMDFDGAPVNGFVAHHKASLGYRFESLSIGLDFVSNDGGTQQGFGDIDGQTLGINVGFNW